MPTFQSLGELGAFMHARYDTPPVTVVDPGIPLLDLTESTSLIGNALRAHPSVRKVTEFIARGVASIPLHVYEFVADDDRQRVRDHPLARVVAGPSALGKPFRFWNAILLDGLLYDRWCALKVTDGDSMLLRRIPARRFRLKGDHLDEVEAVEVFGPDGKSKKFDPARFVWDVGYSQAGAGGTSPLVTLADRLAEVAASVEYRRNVLRNSARVPAVIERSEPWSSPEARSRFAESWAAFMRTGGRSGGTPILEDGMKIAKIDAFNPEEIEDLAARTLTDIEVSSMYHIAPELVGARQGNYSNVDAFRQMLYGPSLGPYIVAWEQAVNASLTPDLAGARRLYVEAHVDAKLRGSFLEQAQAASTATGRPWMTTNEQRARFNLQRVDDGDELVTPLNVLVGGQRSPQDGVSGGGGGALARPADEVAKLVSAAAALIRSGFAPEASLLAVGLDPVDHLGLLPVTVQKPQEPENVDEDLQDEIAKARLALSKGHAVRVKARADRDDEDRAARMLRKFFRRQRDVVLTALGAKAAGEWWDEDRWNSELAADLYSVARPMSEKVGQAVTEAVGGQPDGYNADQTEPFLLAVAKSRAGAVNSTTRDAVEAAIESDDPDVTPAAVFDEAIGDRASGAALMFVTALSAFATTEAAKQRQAGGGGTATKTWVVTSKKPRAEHSRMNGQTVGIDEKFSNGADWPGDPMLGADGVAGCRCDVVVSVEQTDA